MRVFSTVHVNLNKVNYKHELRVFALLFLWLTFKVEML